MGWTHQQGHRGRRGVQRGGVFLAVKEEWRAEMHKVKTDSRGGEQGLGQVTVLSSAICGPHLLLNSENSEIPKFRNYC